mmetsp:Transcript_6630/g.10944  ORF Transcript_6630/g.10944 Transcript_6630/m.10944 type:complete len:405 (+) Transcript_6630:50-1264(+)
MMMPMRKRRMTPSVMMLLSVVLLVVLLLAPPTSHAFTPSPARSSSMKKTVVVVSADSTSFARTIPTSSSTTERSLPEAVIVDGSTISTISTSAALTPPSSIPLYQLALAGAMATVIGDAAMHPIDCIKTLQQSDEGMSLTFIQASQLLYNQYDGIGGFYRGLTTYLVTDAGAGAIKFGVYEALKAWSTRTFASQDEQHQFLQSASLYICAGIAFAASSTILVPGELLKQQLQMGHYGTLGEAVHHIYATSGLSGFLNGYQGVCVRDIPYTMMELGLYDWIKTTILASQQEENNEDESEELRSTLDTSQEIMAAALTGGLAGFLTTPLDTIKTKLMVDSVLYGNDGFAACFATTLHDHGWAALFAGAAARVAWLVPFSAIYLPLFDAMKRQLAATPLFQQQQQGQ